MRISNDDLAAISASGIKVPCYDRKDIRAGIAHIGMGHFHRSHFLGYLDELLDRGLYDKGVFEVDIIPSDKAFIDGLRAQDYMYSVLTLSPEGQETLRIIGAIAGYANYSEEPEKDSESVSEKVKVSKEDSVSVPEEQSAQGTFPNRMRRSYKQLLLWIAEAPSGRAWDEIVRYCAENQDMDERRISFFVANYRSVRYGLLKTSNGTVSITPRGMMYLRREGLLKDDEMNA